MLFGRVDNLNTRDSYSTKSKIPGDSTAWGCPDIWRTRTKAPSKNHASGIYENRTRSRFAQEPINRVFIGPLVHITPQHVKVIRVPTY
ncbi:hypothetical protein ABKN59_011668 [Abortiporus biennis]